MERKTRGGAIYVTSSALHGLLHLPDHYTVTGAAFDILRNCIVVYVQSDELPETKEGTMLPQITPYYQKDQWNQIHLLRIDIEDLD